MNRTTQRSRASRSADRARRSIAARRRRLRRLAKRGELTHLYEQVALWQTLIVVALIAMIWVKEVLDVPALVFGAEPSKMDWLGALVLTIGILSGGIIIVGHTYMQQKQILRGFISVCSYCRKVHMEETDWQRMEEFLEHRTLAEFTHGICPDCYTKVLSQIETETTGALPGEKAEPSQ